MSFWSATATCGQHILDDNDLVDIMDGPRIANNYNEFTMGSLVGSTFKNDPVGSKDCSVTSPNINIKDIDETTNVDPMDTSIINEDDLLDYLFQHH